MMTQNLTELFEMLLQEWQQYLTRYCQDMIAGSRNKHYTLDKVKNNLHAQWRCYIRGVSQQPKAWQYFTDHYNSGNEVQTILQHIEKHYPLALNIKPEFDPKEPTELLNFTEKAETLLQKFPRILQPLVGTYISNLALENILNHLPTMVNTPVAKLQTKSIPAKWTGTNTNKNEFVQLIYSLHLAGFINNGEGEVTKITEVLAEAFDLNLGKNWQSNHSSSIHKAKKNYEPPVFDQIKKAYLAYTNTLLEDKKKK